MSTEEKTNMVIELLLEVTAAESLAAIRAANG
jgi:hypothetical protein